VLCSAMHEKTFLQFAVALAGLVPVTAGALGMFDPGLLQMAQTSSASTHAAYLSGLLLGIGLVFWALVPSIERQQRLFTLLAAIIVLGGIARLLMALRLGIWSPSVRLPLAMELGVTPLLWVWQRRVSQQYRE